MIVPKKFVYMKVLSVVVEFKCFSDILRIICLNNFKIW